MAHEVLMPKLSSTMTEGTITTWLKQEGESVEIGEPIFEVMTDKIAIEVEAYEEGILLKRYLGDGDSAPVNAIVAYIGEEGESVPDAAPPSVQEDESGVSEAEQPDTPNAADAIEEKSKPVTTLIRATPSARRLARQRKIDLSAVEGSGPRGRIQAEDVKRYKPEPAVPVAAPAKTEKAETAEVIPWSGMRKVVADRMSQSKATVPHVTMNASVDMSEIDKLRQHLLPVVEERTALRLSYTELIVKAVTVALKEFPVFNAHALDDGIHLHKEINIGLAVAVKDGLLVPVIRNAQDKGLAELTKTAKDLAGKAREGRLNPDDMQGGTFTISSLGRSRVENFTPIINAPEVAILGVGGMTKSCIMKEEDGQMIPVNVPVLQLSLSFDHRAADGAPAAAFLSRIVEILENPLQLLL
ncbi:dihydrolipoamide acetyltransferase family protein [Vagococcus acidifermentans]|uniref:Dihydrolipoamide acetyltransferase component of pyruvate dehydrogenase complex n=1 Tax=Vagococcus acidifermentans TaxID=564710 RepID=A0A430ASD5_9ENTE|nr:dihydrolipoamide acetyltransferase family protein [Vagococcus acidifermentans]RSU10956.1 acetoin dehydrogenase [Vagococcus acidifermentans]